ncbi:cytoplasmic protein [Shigella flexneri]|nr:DcrB-related protein [Shigella flexneri]SUI54595.1 cytoplasmic protein [Shigella flexneri]
MTSLYRIQEGCFALPETFLDRTVNIFVPSGNERATPSLNISRDTLRPDENLTTYIGRQIALMKKKKPRPAPGTFAGNGTGGNWRSCHDR